MKELKLRGYYKAEHYNNDGLEHQELTDREVVYIDGTREGRMIGLDELRDLLGYEDIEKTLFLMLYTGFQDSEGTDIYDGDIIGDWVDADEGLVQSKCQVYWCQKTGSWMLCPSLCTDKPYGFPLWSELNTFEYKVIGNIHEGITK